ncbi:hypothetical protein PybrP1_010807 [[Pythium] brassicae (nom. inval.)]|nr:hypothetical protein PybrP1_010807 [[Pythium] brassicae (nom. inval.)]
MAAPRAAAPFAAALRVAFWRKPRHMLHQTHSPATAASDSAASTASASSASGDAREPREMRRTLGLFDLTMIGIGGTVGSGVFATAGLIAHAYAGPAAVLSWLIAGLGCLLSGFSFMELSCLLPSAGSTYAYAYHALGELPAMCAGFLLTLEYGVSSAGGARSWSDKFTNWLETELHVRGPVWMKPPDSTVDLYAGLLMAACVAVVLCGMQAGKRLVNVVTMTKISVVLFIIVAGLLRFDAANVTPFVPPATSVVVSPTTATGEAAATVTTTAAFGWPGVFLGASASFFGYIGFDEVCCLAGEATHPTRSIPRAVVGTIVGAALLSTLATLALVGMQPHAAIDTAESFGKAFEHVGWPRAATVVTTGEVLTMPITTFIGFLAQPRVQYAMAADGLLPAVFARVDAHGNLFQGTLLCGVAATAVAVFVPFHVLWNFISLGILVAFNLTNASLLLVRAAELRARSGGAHAALHDAHPALIGSFLVASLVAAFHWQKRLVATPPPPSEDAATTRSPGDAYMDAIGAAAAAFFTAVALGLVGAIKYIDVVTPATPPTRGSSDGKRKTSGALALELSDSTTRLAQLQKRRDDEHPGSHLRARTLSDGGDEADHCLEAGPLKTKAGGTLSPVDLGGDRADDDSAGGGDAASEDSEGVEPPPLEQQEEDPQPETFRTPLVPFAPCVAIAFNWFLFAQMEASSVLLIALWLLLALAVYVGYSRHHSLAHQQTAYRRVDVQ